METVIGFAVGYWIGTRQGREGLRRALDSARAIWESPETRRLVTEGLSALEGARNGRAMTISSVVDELIDRRQRRPAHAA